MPSSLKITDLPPSKRPRERLISTGLKNLTDPELVAIILGSGSQKRNALKLARQVLILLEKKDFQVKLDDLTKLYGIGQIKATKILSLIEFGRRQFGPQPVNRILKPTDVLPEVKQLRTSQREHLIGLYLNARYELQAKETLAVGSLNHQQLEMRDILAKAISLPSRCILLVHNHPSGNPQPSEADLITTKKIKKACQLLGIELLDHLIITRNNCLSFKEEQLL